MEESKASRANVQRVNVERVTVERAQQFLSRAKQAKDYKRKLICLYDGFVCLYGPSACSEAASCVGMSDLAFKGLVDSCTDDGDWERLGGVVSSGFTGVVEALERYLSTVL
ncbi:MAG: hypothetical protein HUK23_06790 [Sphaerochaetaceae bacterium]|nr:hypothetical protein [Sphaerochaetaceae bacterium]